jgi:hypothetical protein
MACGQQEAGSLGNHPSQVEHVQSGVGIIVGGLIGHGSPKGVKKPVDHTQ